MDIPRIISVDDHVVEPPDLWTERIPAKFKDRAPAGRARLGEVPLRGRRVLLREGRRRRRAVRLVALRRPRSTRSRSCRPRSASPSSTSRPITFDEIRPGCWNQSERLADMDANHVEASLCFPNTLPRFCGQTFLERDDKELALLCVQAYNDWMIDEWCAGEGKGRLIPLTMVPLWDAELAAAEVRRCADKGSHAVTFSENPYPLGLPSIHDKDRYWDPFFQACEETETTVCMHIGSSSKMPSTSPDAPFIVSSTLTFPNAMGSMCDYIFSGTLERFPTLKIAYSEGQVGWMPYVLERADKLWPSGPTTASARRCRSPPPSYVPARIYGCIFDDEIGLANRDVIGMDQICFETDYPHADSHLPALEEGRRGHLHPGRPRRRGALQAPAGQRDHRVRAGALRHHQVVDPWLTGCCSSTTPTVSARSRSTGPRSRTRSTAAMRDGLLRADRRGRRRRRDAVQSSSLRWTRCSAQVSTSRRSPRGQGRHRRRTVGRTRARRCGP